MADVMLWWQYVVLVGYYILLPFVWIFEHLIAVLSVVLAPLLHVLSYALHVALIPFGLLAKFETLYIYFGTAVLLGLFTGLALYVLTALVNPALGIRGSSTDIDGLHADGLHLDRFHIDTLREKLWLWIRPWRRLLRFLRSLDTKRLDDEDASTDDDDDDDERFSNLEPGARTAASFNAERAERRARLARQQALLPGLSAAKLSVHSSGGSGSGTGSGTGSNKTRKARRRGDAKLVDDNEWVAATTTAAAAAASREFGAPTPMMGTMILEEEDSSE